jgi:hypothetical protein
MTACIPCEIMEIICDHTISAESREPEYFRPGVLAQNFFASKLSQVQANFRII